MTFHPQLILVPVDVDGDTNPGYAEAALRQAADVAIAYKAKLHVLSCVPYPVLPAGFDSTVDFAGTMAGLQQARVDFAGKALDQLLLLAQGRGIAGETEVLVNTTSIAGAIVRRAEEMKVDLIALNTHGRKGLKRYLIGSVAERVVHLAPCPVLLFRPPDEDQDSE